MESIYLLIEEAIEVSPEFKQKLIYWIHKRKRTPDIKWLLLQLSHIYSVKELEHRLRT